MLYFLQLFFQIKKIIIIYKHVYKLVYTIRLYIEVVNILFTIEVLTFIIFHGIIQVQCMDCMLCYNSCLRYIKF